MKALRLLPIIALAACANLNTVEDKCGANVRPFVETWPCVRTNAASLPGPSDLKRYYFATGDVVSERIRRGEMTEAEGRMVMASALTDAMNADARRRPVYTGPTTYQRVGPGTVIAY